MAFEMKTADVNRVKRKTFKYVEAVDPYDGVRKNLTMNEWVEQHQKWTERFPAKFPADELPSRQAMYYRYDVAEERGFTGAQIIGSEPMPERAKPPTAAEQEDKDQNVFDIRSKFLGAAW